MKYLSTFLPVLLFPFSGPVFGEMATPSHAKEPSQKMEWTSAYATTGYDWKTSTPEEQGLEPGVLWSAYQRAAEIPRIYSLLVVKNGYLVAERYFNGQDVNRANPIASVTKSFTSALVGIALREGYLNGLDQKMLDFFPEYTTAALDPRKHEITLRLMLQMRTGYPFDSTSSFFDQLTGSGNWMRFIIVDHPLETDPGTSWAYSNASAILFSRILTRATGMSVMEFANWYLFEPLGTRIEVWPRDPQGYYVTSGDMHLTPRDMALFGYVYLNQGGVDRQQIVPREWVEESLADYSRTSYGDMGPYRDIRYGYLWWHAEARGRDVYFAWGHGGNFIVIVPTLDMIVVTTADAFIGDFTSASWRTEGAIFFSIADDVLPAAEGVPEPPPYPPSNVRGTRLENRSLFQIELIDNLRWEANPRNVGENITTYRIYRYAESGRKVLLAEVDSSTTSYVIRDAERRGAVYGIAAVTGDHEESVPGAVSVQ